MCGEDPKQEGKKRRLREKKIRNRNNETKEKNK